MPEPTVLVGKKSGYLVPVVFLAVMFAAALLRGCSGARTSTGRVVLVSTMGTLVVVCVAYAVWLIRQPPERLEIDPDRVVLWQRPGRGMQLGPTPPLLVRRTLIRVGRSMTTRWVLTDASSTASRLAGDALTPLQGVLAQIPLIGFHPTEVTEALRRAGWSVEQRT